MAKATRVVWTRPALNSLLAIVQHIQADSPSATRRLADQIKGKVARLERFPVSGRLVREFHASGLREVIVGDHRIIYRFREAQKTVEVLTVWHGARLLESDLEET